MIKVNVQFKIEEARIAFRDQQRQITLAASRAINRAADAGKAEAARAISLKTKLKITKVRKRLAVRGANADKLMAEILAYAYSPNLADFGARETQPGVSAAAWESRKVYRLSFMTPSGKVVARVGKARFPLKGLRGPSLPKAFISDSVVRSILVRVYEVFPREFQRELERRIGV